MKKKMTWFKHYCNMGESMSVNNMIDEFGVDYYAHYVLLLELICSEYDEERNQFQATYRTDLARATNGW